MGEAEPLMRRTLAIHERSLGPEHPDVATGLNNLAQLLEATNRMAEAEPLYAACAGDRRAVVGTGTPQRRRPPQPTWRSCSRPPNGWPRPGLCCGGRWAILVTFRRQTGFDHPERV